MFKNKYKWRKSLNLWKNKMSKLIAILSYIIKYQVMKHVMLRYSSTVVTVESGYDNFYNMNTNDPKLLSYNRI